MKTLTLCALLALAAVVLFPPATSRKSVNGSEMAFNAGYTFVTGIGGPVLIRYEEWFSAIAIVGVLAGALFLCAKQPGACPWPVFWLLASAFAWGLFVAPFVRRRIRDLFIVAFRESGAPLRDYSTLTGWTTLLTYPAICWMAALLLLRAQRKGSRPLAIAHLAAGFVWIALVLFATLQFGRAFRN